MEYSYQQIFNEYGQYDSFVYLTFVPQSEAHTKFGEELSGTFLYAREDRIRLENNLKEGIAAQDTGYIRFAPSTMSKLPAELKVHLDKKGILSTDIVSIDSINLRPKENRFAHTGQKELQNLITIEVPPSDNPEVEVERIKLGMYVDHYRNGYMLIQEEKYEFIGLALFYIPNRLDPRMKEEYADTQTGKFIAEVRFYELRAKMTNEKATKEEGQEYLQLLEERLSKRANLLAAELKSSSSKLKEVADNYGANLNALMYLCSTFDTTDMRLSHEKIPIWWDFERFLHIYIRHVKETRVGEEFEGKSLFQYKYRDIKTIVGAVVKQVYNEFINHVIQNPDKEFFRIGKRSVYHDGTYYALQIESTGRLMTFYPYTEESTA
jgi:hypothetical protein